MTTLEFHVLKLRGADGRTIDVPVVMLRDANGKIVKRMSYKQYKKASSQLPPLQPSPDLKHLLEQKKKMITV